MLTGKKASAARRLQRSSRLRRRRNSRAGRLAGIVCALSPAIVGGSTLANSRCFPVAMPLRAGIYSSPDSAVGRQLRTRLLAFRARMFGLLQALIAAAGLAKAFTFCSSGGGATLEFIGRGDDLPGLVHLFRDQ